MCYPTEASFLSIQKAIHPLLHNTFTTPRQVMHLFGLLASTEKLVCVASSRSSGYGSRCSGDELVWTTSVLLPSYSSLSSRGQEVHELSELQDASCSTFLGNQGVASRSFGTVNKKASGSSSKKRPLKTTSS